MTATSLCMIHRTTSETSEREIVKSRAWRWTSRGRSIVHSSRQKIKDLWLYRSKWLAVTSIKTLVRRHSQRRSQVKPSARSSRHPGVEQLCLTHISECLRFLSSTSSRIRLNSARLLLWVTYKRLYTVVHRHYNSSNRVVITWRRTLLTMVHTRKWVLLCSARLRRNSKHKSAIPRVSSVKICQSQLVVKAEGTISAKLAIQLVVMLILATHRRQVKTQQASRTRYSSAYCSRWVSNLETTKLPWRSYLQSYIFSHKMESYWKQRI